MTPSELVLLRSIARGKRFIECGACIGGSTIPLAEVAGHVVSIDKHKDYGPSTLGLYLANISPYMSRITPIVGDVLEVLPQQVGDVALIDLLGTFELTAQCLELIPASVQVVAVHDVGRPYCSGVDLALRGGLWTPIAQADTLVVLGR